MTAADVGAGVRVVVVGSIHLDMQVDVPRLPRPGETVLGSTYRRSPGGKGANQAVAAAVAGQSVTLIGRVGDDSDGLMVRSEVEARGVDVGFVDLDPHEPTGVAMILVDDAGANQIAVSPGASGRLSPEDVARGAKAIATARVLLLQLEVPIETVRAAIECAGDRTIVVLNPAPARELPPDLLRRVDVLVPNLLELGQLAGEPDLDNLPRAARVARRLCASLRAEPTGRRAVVVTLGGDGALLVDGEDDGQRDGQPASHVPAEQVDVVDTTGAGDAFCGALAGWLAAGTSLPVAVPAANRFAAASTARRGALSSYLGTAGEPVPADDG